MVVTFLAILLATSPTWSEWVVARTSDAAPVFAPDELRGVRKILIGDDIGGLGNAIERDLAARLPEIRFETNPTSAPDGMLSFQFGYRCQDPHAPDGFYVTEAILFRPADASDSASHAHILYHWTDHGDPTWRHVSSSCTSAHLSSQCRAAIAKADIAFTGNFARVVAAAGQPRPQPPN